MGAGVRGRPFGRIGAPAAAQMRAAHDFLHADALGTSCAAPTGDRRVLVPGAARPSSSRPRPAATPAPRPEARRAARRALEIARANLRREAAAISDIGVKAQVPNGEVTFVGRWRTRS